MANHILLPDGELITVHQIDGLYCDVWHNLNIVLSCSIEWTIEHDNEQQAKNSMRALYGYMVHPKPFIATVMFNGVLTQSLEKEKQFLENI